jgi:hypothetical protein
VKRYAFLFDILCVKIKSKCLNKWFNINKLKKTLR